MFYAFPFPGLLSIFPFNIVVIKMQFLIKYPIHVLLIIFNIFHIKMREVFIILKNLIGTLPTIMYVC